MEQGYPALFAEEIFIVQMHGRDEEASRLERLLDECVVESNGSGSVDKLPKKQICEILALAEAIRDRQKLGMHWSCCWRCQKYLKCDERLARHRASIRCNCCKHCKHYQDCRRKCVQ